MQCSICGTWMDDVTSKPDRERDGDITYYECPHCGNCEHVIDRR